MKHTIVMSFFCIMSVPLYSSEHKKLLVPFVEMLSVAHVGCAISKCGEGDVANALVHTITASMLCVLAWHRDCMNKKISAQVACQHPHRIKHQRKKH